MIKVGLNGRLLYENSQRGWNRYLLNLLFELRQLDVDLFIYSDRPVHPSLKKRLGPLNYRASGRCPYPYWEQVWLPYAVARDGVDIFHTPMHYGLPVSLTCPSVMTLHDTISDKFYRDNPKFPRRWGDRKLAFHERIARRKSTHYITVSEFSKQDIVSYYNINPSKISVIKEAADLRFDGISSDLNLPFELKDQPYLFYVGGYEARKNIKFLIESFLAYESQDLLLVLAGNHAEFPIIDHPRILSMGTLDDDILKAIYAHARAFVYPSLYEGFGLQLCEAMKMSCPIFASNRTSLPEILGTGGEIFDLDSPASLHRLIEKVLNDEAYYQDLKQRSKERSKDFSWEKAARQTLAVYDRVVSAK